MVSGRYLRNVKQQMDMLTDRHKFCCHENSKDWDPTTMLDTMSIS